jgi:hypothetical protein
MDRMAFLENGMMNQWISFLIGKNEGFTMDLPPYFWPVSYTKMPIPTILRV